MEPKDFVKHARGYLEQNAFQLDAAGNFAGLFTADLYALKKGRSLGIFFPYEDHLFFHALDAREANDAARIRALHEGERSYVNSLFKLPRALRYKVPNIVTVGVSAGGFSGEVIDYAKAPQVSIVGGEKHSVILIDLANRSIISQGMETTYARGIGITFRQVNPTNRAQVLVADLARTVLGVQ
jgi:hypothetical protein